MLTITNVPPGTATEQTLALQFTEPICPYVRENSLTSSVSYVLSDVNVVGTTATAIVTAQLTTQFVPLCRKVAKTIINTETFPIAFTATTTNQITITPQTVISDIVANGCKKKNVVVTTAITASIV